MRRAALVLVLLLAGCGTGGLGEAESSGSGGGDLFKEKCGGCHTLAAAGTRGTIGPSLDAAFEAPKEERFDESSIREVVLGQMRYPVPPMPPPEELFPSKDFTDEERDTAMESIAAYVADVSSNQEAIDQAEQQGGGSAAGGGNDAKTLFTSNCAPCHTFAAAGTNGKVGPNLDRISLDVGQIADQIRHGGGGMPPFEGQLTDAQIQALATYVNGNRGG